MSTSQVIFDEDFEKITEEYRRGLESGIVKDFIRNTLGYSLLETQIIYDFLCEKNHDKVIAVITMFYYKYVNVEEMVTKYIKEDVSSIKDLINSFYGTKAFPSIAAENLTKSLNRKERRHSGANYETTRYKRPKKGDKYYGTR